MKTSCRGLLAVSYWPLVGDRVGARVGLLTNRYRILLLALFFLPAIASAQKTEINPSALSKPTGYSHVVIAGNTIYISGQVPLDEKGQVVGKGDLKQQLTKVYDNLKVCLQSAGATFENVVKMNTYIVNLKTEDVSLIREVRKQYLSADHPPASTLVGVTALVNPDLMVEIEMIAVK